MFYTVYLDKVIQYWPRIRIKTKKIHIRMQDVLDYNHPVMQGYFKTGFEVSMFWADWPQPKNSK